MEKEWVLQAEYAVIAVLLASNDAFDRVGHFLRPEHFSSLVGQKVYKSIFKALSSGSRCDAITVYEDVVRNDPETDITFQEVNSIATSSAYKSMISKYAHSLVEHYGQCKLVEAINQAYELATDESLSIEDRVARVAAAIDGAGAQAQTGNEPVKLGDLMPAYLDKLQRNADGVEVDCIPTGLERLDSLLGGGLRPGKVYVLAARPSVGKSAVAQAICESSARHGKPAAMFSQEMTNDEMVDRAISRIGGVSMGFHNRTIKGDGQDFSLALEASEIAATLPVWLFDGAGLRLQEIASRARTLKRKHGLSLLAIDYLQLCQSTNPKASRHHQIEEISRGVKVLAKELGIPVLLLSQLNRDVEKRNPPRPIASDLKESGAIEEDADAIILMWTHEEGDTALLGFDVAKNRGGAKGSFGVRFVKKYQQFHDTDEQLREAVQKKSSGYGF